MQPVFIDDLVDGIIAALFHGKIGNSYILCGPEVVTVKEFFTYLARMIGKTTIPSIPGWLALLMAQVLELVSRFTGYSIPFTRCAVRGCLMRATYNCNKAYQELGYTPKVTLVEGMKEVKKWLAGKQEKINTCYLPESQNF